MSRTASESFEREPNGSAANGIYGEESTVQTKIEHADGSDKDLPCDRIFVESGIRSAGGRRRRAVYTR